MNRDFKDYLYFNFVHHQATKNVIWCIWVFLFFIMWYHIIKDWFNNKMRLANFSIVLKNKSQIFSNSTATALVVWLLRQTFQCCEWRPGTPKSVFTTVFGWWKWGFMFRTFHSTPLSVHHGTSEFIIIHTW